MGETKKRLDAVAMTRAARDKISAEIEGLTLEEELQWLASRDLRDPVLERLRGRAAPRGEAEDRSSAGR